MKTIRFWRPDAPGVVGMFRLDGATALKTRYSEHYSVIAVLAGAFDGMKGGETHAYVAGGSWDQAGGTDRARRNHGTFAACFLCRRRDGPGLMAFVRVVTNIFATYPRNASTRKRMKARTLAEVARAAVVSAWI